MTPEQRAAAITLTDIAAHANAAHANATRADIRRALDALGITTVTTPTRGARRGTHRVSAAQSIALVRDARDRGMTWDEIVERTGVPRTTIRSIHAGHWDGILTTTATAIAQLREAS